MTDLPSFEGMSCTLVCVPFSVPFSKVNVSTTLCHGCAGVGLWKSSENRSSFFLAMGSLGILASLGWSAAYETDVRIAMVARSRVVMAEANGVRKALYR